MTNYTERFLNELNSKGKLCDLIIGDSQWIGGSAENGHYHQAERLLRQERHLDGRLRAGDGDWLFRMAQEHPNYWALARAMGDVVGWTYRKDWFSNPDLQAEFKTKYGWDLAPPATFDQLKQIAEFFQGRTIDGKTVYGTSLYTERGSEGVTMGAMDVLYSYGFKIRQSGKAV